MDLHRIVVGLAFMQASVYSCPFPDAWIGTWVSSTDETWTINGTHILNYPTFSTTTGTPITASGSYMNFSCSHIWQDKYIIMSEPFELFTNSFINLYQCLQITMDSTSKLIYYKATAIDNLGFQFTSLADNATICNLNNYNDAYNYHVALAQGNETSGTTTCPSSLFGSYNYDTCTDPASNDTSMNVCDTRTQLIFNMTLCSTQHFFSANGTLNCLWHTTSGSYTYLTVYNADTVEPDRSSTYRFTCLVVQQLSGSVVNVSSYADRCMPEANDSANSYTTVGDKTIFTAYYLCPITTASSETSDSSLIYIIIGVIAGLLLITAIILILIFCVKRKRRREKEKDEERTNAIQRRSSSVKSASSHSSQRSLDSGISELPVSGRTDSGRDRDEEDGRGLADTERSRLSDLPASTIMSDDGGQTPRKGEELKEDDDAGEDATDGGHDNHDGGKAEDDKHNRGQDDGTEDQGAAGTGKDGDGKTTVIVVGSNSDKEGGEEKKKGRGKDGDPGRHGDGTGHVGDGRGDVEYDSDGQPIRTRDGNIGSDDQRKVHLKTGGKGEFQPAGALTTVLVSREADERKREKQKRKKNKSKNMRKLAMKKLKKYGIVGHKGKKAGIGDTDDEYGATSDEDVKRTRGPADAPFMKQYEEKKHLEHILDEQHYWSDPEADKDIFGSVNTITSDSESEIEEEVIGPDGVPIIIRRPKTRKQKRGGDGDDISNASSEYLRMKMLKRAGSVDTLASVEDPADLDNNKSKRRLNEHTVTTGKTDDGLEDENNKDGTKGINVEGKTVDVPQNGSTAKKGSMEIQGGKENEAHGKGAKPILVKEQSSDSLTNNNKDKRVGKDKSGRIRNGNMTGGKGGTGDGRNRTHGRGATDGVVNGGLFDDSDLDKLSDRDSGMDDEDEDVDVTLNKDQQQMIVNMLFDEEMNLRPQFARNDNGQIVRRLDNSVIYDPHTGRFTFRKRLGQLFKLPRLRRDDKGRPLGGFVEDAFGPTENEPPPWQQRTSSARHSGRSVRSRASVRSGRSAKSGRSGRSGRSGKDISNADNNTGSPSADLKRYRADGRSIVDFNVPDDDMDTIPEDQLDINKRGRRDIGSAVRRKLQKRLFKKKKTHGGAGGPLPDIRSAWADNSHHHMNGGFGTSAVHSPFNPHRHRPDRGTTGDSTHWQMYRDGLESDRRILENLQDKLNTGESPFATRDAFMHPPPADMNGANMDHYDSHGHSHGDPHSAFLPRGKSYMSEDGRLVVRERGCPELKPKVPLFTIVRRPGDLEQGEDVATRQNQQSPDASPMQLQDYNADNNEQDANMNQRNRYTSENSIVARSMDGSQMTSIDDNRLRRLLEELYTDKKYFDKYVQTTELKTETDIQSKGLAEHGRGYLLERANFWERRGPLPPRPPMTAVGWKMQRQQQLSASRQLSELGCSTITGTPDVSITMPGVVESPRVNGTGPDKGGDNFRGNTPEESFV